MSEYIATFYTHLSALKSQESLARAGIPARLAPTPRALSASCGACVRYRAEAPLAALLDAHWEGVYLAEAGAYESVLKNE